MKRDKLWKRIFEIIPGFLTWATLIGLFVLAFVKPIWVAVFVITFDLYWVIRTLYLTTLLLFAYRMLKIERRYDWIKRCKALAASGGLTYGDIYHAVIFPSYKEGPEILAPSIAALERADYPKDRMIVVLSVEARAGDAAWRDAVRLREEHAKNFLHFIVTRHPDGLPGEVKVKGANATWGAKVLKDYIDSMGIGYERVVVSCFDADTCADPEYFGCLA